MTVVERIRGEPVDAMGPEREEPRESTADEDFLIDMLNLKYIGRGLAVQADASFHPTDEGLSVGTPSATPSLRGPSWPLPLVAELWPGWMDIARRFAAPEDGMLWENSGRSGRGRSKPSAARGALREPRLYMCGLDRNT